MEEEAELVRQALLEQVRSAPIDPSLCAYVRVWGCVRVSTGGGGERREGGGSPNLGVWCRLMAGALGG